MRNQNVVDIKRTRSPVEAGSTADETGVSLDEHNSASSDSKMHAMNASENKAASKVIETTSGTS